MIKLSPKSNKKLLKTPCGVTPPPPHFGARRFHDSFRQVALAGLCLPILWWILFDLVWSWQISSEPCLFICRFKKTHLQTSVQRRCPKTTTNPVTILSKVRKIDPKSITNRPKIHQKSIGIDSGKRSGTEAQRGATVKINIEAFWRHLADFGRNFGPRWISKGQSARCFSMYFALAKNT